MKDFKIVSSAESADALKKHLKDAQLEQYGEQFTPEFVYEAIKQNPKFSNMRVSFVKALLML
jgi:ubiquitin carboxyl-terminal hydrolase 10